MFHLIVYFDMTLVKFCKMGYIFLLMLSKKSVPLMTTDTTNVTVQNVANGGFDVRGN